MKREWETPTAGPYQAGAAKHFVHSLRQRGRIGFSLDELVQATSLSALAARRQLERLSPSVVHVTPRQAFFLIVDPEHHLLGAPPPAWWLDGYFGWLERPYYLCLQSAAAEHGSAAQAVQATQVMTDQPRRDIELGRIRITFFVKSALNGTLTQQAAHAFAPLAISTPEATVVELVQYAPRIGGIERVAETMEPLLTRLRPSALAALVRDVETPTLQRLGFLLDALGATHLADVVQRRLPRARKFVPLVIGTGQPLPQSARIDQRWCILDNASVRSSE